MYAICNTLLSVEVQDLSTGVGERLVLPTFPPIEIVDSGGAIYQFTSMMLHSARTALVSAFAAPKEMPPRAAALMARA